MSSSSLRVWMEPRGKTIEGHTAECVLLFNGEEVWGPVHCHHNTTRLKEALNAADSRFDMIMRQQAKTVQGHFSSISVRLGSHCFLDRMHTHASMQGLCDAVESCLAHDKGGNGDGGGDGNGDGNGDGDEDGN